MAYQNNNKTCYLYKKKTIVFYISLLNVIIILINFNKSCFTCGAEVHSTRHDLTLTNAFGWYSYAYYAMLCTGNNSQHTQTADRSSAVPSPFFPSLLSFVFFFLYRCPAVLIVSFSFYFSLYSTL